MPSVQKQPCVFKYNLAYKVKFRERKIIRKLCFYFWFYSYPLCYFTTACQCLLLTWESVEVAKSSVHCRGGTVLWFRESTFFSTGSTSKTWFWEVERLKCWDTEKLSVSSLIFIMDFIKTSVEIFSCLISQNSSWDWHTSFSFMSEAAT